MNSSEQNVCPSCLEPVRAGAKKCPHCHEWLRWKSGLALNIVLMVAMLGGLLFWARYQDGQRRGVESFAAHRDRIVVSESRLHVSRSGPRTYVSTVGKIRNDSEFAWKDLYLEARYFNDSGELIDADGSEQSGLELLPGAEFAFRLRAVADKPESEYARHELAITAARHSRLCSGR